MRFSRVIARLRTSAHDELHSYKDMFSMFVKNLMGLLNVMNYGEKHAQHANVLTLSKDYFYHLKRLIIQLSRPFP